MKTYKSLQYRLVAAFFLVASVALVTLAGILYVAAYDKIDKSYGAAADATASRNRMAAKAVEQNFLIDENWDHIEGVIKDLGEEFQRSVVLVDKDDIIIAHSSVVVVEDTEHKPNLDNEYVLYIKITDENDEEKEIARLCIAGKSEIIDTNIFYAFFFIACAVALTISIAFSSVLSGRILKPVSKLTVASEELTAGKLDARVAIRDDSEFGRLADTFNVMAAEIERSHKNSKAMVADIAHELRTPLTNISGYLEAIQDGIVAPDEQTIKSIIEEAGSLSRLVNDLHQLSVAEASNLTLDMEETDINVLLERAYLAKQHEASSRGISVEYEETHLPKTVADPQRIYQVILNLLNNAIAHTERGTVLIKAACDEKEIKVAIIDTGEGVPENELSNIFERFYRVDKSRSRKSGGTGLGLTIAKTLILAHNGHIGAESAQGVGSKFWFSIPLKTMPGKHAKMEDLL